MIYVFLGTEINLINKKINDLIKESEIQNIIKYDFDNSKLIDIINESNYIDLFNEKGYKFRLDDIAEQLYISKKTIYTVFLELLFSLLSGSF